MEIKDITEGNRVFQSLEVGRSIAIEKGRKWHDKSGEGFAGKE